MRVPTAPEFTGTNIAWAGALTVAILVATGLLALVWQPLAVAPSALLLLAAVYLIGGELWEKRRAQSP